jgi:hypothetical protein
MVLLWIFTWSNLGCIDKSSSKSSVKEKWKPQCLASVMWWISGIWSLLTLPTGLWYSAEFFWIPILPDIERNLCGGEPRKTLRGIYLNLDNAPASKAKRSRQEIARTKSTSDAYPANSPGPALGCFSSERITQKESDTFWHCRRFREIELSPSLLDILFFVVHSLRCCQFR